jgi:hypothetical protein
MNVRNEKRRTRPLSMQPRASERRRAVALLCDGHHMDTTIAVPGDGVSGNDAEPIGAPLMRFAVSRQSVLQGVFQIPRSSKTKRWIRPKNHCR